MANPFVGIGGFFGRFFGNTIGEAAAYGIGGALQEPLRPALQALANETWQAATVLGVSKPLAAGTAAEVAAEHVALKATMATEASYSGYDADRFDNLYGLSLTAPGLGTLLELLRRTQTHPVDFPHGLRKGKLETEWDAALTALRDLPLGPDVIAVAIQRGVMDAPFALPYTPPTATGNIAAYPASALDAAREAEWSGETVERLRIRTALAGLPLALDQAARGYFRNVLKIEDYDRAVLEGNTRGEWGRAALDVARQIPTAHDGIEGRLRGWFGDPEMYAQTARHGMSKADTDLLFKVTGRPLSFHQVFIGERRGGKYDGPLDVIDPHFLKSLQESNMRPEWYNLAWAQRYTYPSAFVLRALTQGHDISQVESENILLYEGWEPTLAAKVSTKWYGGVGAKADPHLAKAQTKAWTEAQSSYIAEESTSADVQPIFTLLAVDPTAQPEILATWDAIRALVRKQLSPKEIQKAVGGGIVNPATGVAWTMQDGIDALLARGYDLADATVLLQE